MRGPDLRLDREAHLVVAATLHQVEQVGEARDPRAVDRLLVRVLPGVVAAGIQAADIVRLQLRPGKRMDRRPAPVEKLAACVARDRRVERWIVIDHEHSVARDRDVELERGDAKVERALERRKRVLRREAAHAAMALKIEGVRCAAEKQRA